MKVWIGTYFLLVLVGCVFCDSFQDILVGNDPIDIGENGMVFSNDLPVVMKLEPSMKITTSLSCNQVGDPAICKIHLIDDQEYDSYRTGQLNLSARTPEYYNSFTVQDFSLIGTRYILFLVESSIMTPYLHFQYFTREYRKMNHKEFSEILSLLSLPQIVRKNIDKCTKHTSCSDCVVFSSECGWFKEDSEFCLYEDGKMVFCSVLEKGICGEITYKNLVYAKGIGTVTTDGGTFSHEIKSEDEVCAYGFCTRQWFSVLFWVILFISVPFVLLITICCCLVCLISLPIFLSCPICGFFCCGCCCVLSFLYFTNVDFTTYKTLDEEMDDLKV